MEPPLEGVQHPYLLEIWQNVNGRKAVWHTVATFDRGCWYDMNANRLGPRQVAMRWVKISDIASGWQTFTSLEGMRRGPYEVVKVEPGRHHPYLIDIGPTQLWVGEARICQGEEIED